MTSRRVASPLVIASAYGAGQVVGVVVLVTIIGFAIRDQVRKRRRKPWGR